MKRMTLLTIFLLLIGLSAASVAQAQDSMTSFSYNGLSIEYPSDWLAEASPDGGIFLASSDSAMALLRNDQGELDDFEVAYYLLPPSFLAQVGLAPDADPQEALEAILSALGLTGNVRGYDMGDVSGATVAVFSPVIPSGYAQMYALGLESGTVLAILQITPGSTSLLPAVNLLRSLTYTPGGGAGSADTESSKQFISAGGEVAFRVPVGWVVEESEPFIALANSQAAMDNNLNGSSLADDEVVILIALPAALEQLGLTRTSAPVVVIATVMTEEQLNGDIRNYPVQGVSVSNALVTGAQVEGEAALNAYGLPSGTVFAFFQAGGTLERHQPIIEDFVTSIIQETLALGSSTTTQASAGASAELRQWASSAAGTSQFGTTNWSFQQATGAPDTDGCGDRGTAWASSNSRGSDILALEFTEAVIPTQVNIYQTYNPGSIIQVELINTETSEIIRIPNSADAPGNTPCPGIFTLNVSEIDSLVNGVIIYLDQTIGGNWNEIDAVELVGMPISADHSTVTAESAEEKTEFTVVITDVGPSKIDVIRAVRAIANLGLAEAKELIESERPAVLEGVSREVAEGAKKMLEEAGAKVELVGLPVTSAGSGATLSADADIPAFAQADHVVTGTLTSTVIQQNWLTNHGSGDRITVTMVADDPGSLDTLLEIYTLEAFRAGGEPLARNDDAGSVGIGSVFNSQIRDLDITQGGDYIIVATRASGQGSYRLAIESRGAAFLEPWGRN